MKQLLLLLCLATLSAAPSDPTPKKIKLPKAYVYIPSGTCTIGGKKLSVQGFFMQATEVTNLNYREFLADLERQGRTDLLEKARIRPEGWRIPNTYNEPLVENYHQHPAYENYPVVNITQEAARLYCEWLTEKLRARYPEIVVQARLPLESEWVYAAHGGRDGAPYPNGYFLRNADGKSLYCYRSFGDESITRNPTSGDLSVRTDALNAAPQANGFGPAPAESNHPNDFGLYNTSGNVAEMLAEDGRTKGGCFNSTGYDIRIDAADEFAGFTGVSPFIGFRPVVTVVGQ